MSCGRRWCAIRTLVEALQWLFEAVWDTSVPIMATAGLFNAAIRGAKC